MHVDGMEPPKLDSKDFALIIALFGLAALAYWLFFA